MGEQAPCVDEIARKLPKPLPRRICVPDEPELVEVPRAPRKMLVTPEERERIARIAAKIPDRLDLARLDFGPSFVRWAVRQSGIDHAKFYRPRRDGEAVGVAALIAVVLRELDPNRFSYPKIARFMGRSDHAAVIRLVRQWPKHAARWPYLKELRQKARRECGVVS